MPALSAVASKGRRLFSRDSGGAEWSQRSSTPARPSVLTLNEALEQGWSAASSPHCLSNQLRSPPPSSTAHSTNSLGKEFGRRRSSNATTTSTSSEGAPHDGVQRRRKSLFSKKMRAHLPSEREAQEAEGWSKDHLVDPFARAEHRRQHTDVQADLSAKRDAVRELRSAERSSQQRSLRQLEQRKEALQRVSDLVCLAVENQMAASSGLTSPSSPEFLSPSSTLFDTSSYQDAEPSWPTIAVTSDEEGSSQDLSAHSTALMRMVAGQAYEGSDVDACSSSPSLATWDSVAVSPFQDACGLTVPWGAEDCIAPHQILLPCSMKRAPMGAGGDVGKRSNASLKAQVGHGFERQVYEPSLASRPSSPQPEWSAFAACAPSLPPPPPLRPSRNPLRKRSKSLCATVAARQDRHARASTSSPPPPLPSPPMPCTADEQTAESEAAMLLMQTPPRSRRSSEHRPRFVRSDSFTSAASSGSLNAAPFHTPTFGSQSWSTLPVA